MMRGHISPVFVIHPSDDPMGEAMLIEQGRCVIPQVVSHLFDIIVRDHARGNTCYIA